MPIDSASIPVSESPRDDPIWRPPPFLVEAEFAPGEARAFAETVPEHVEKKGGVQLRDRFNRGQGVTVAVLDTGISERHLEGGGDLENAYVDGRDFTSSRYGIDDPHGHGTHCSGIIAADNDGVGTSSILDRCRLIVGKVLGDSGSGSSSWIAAGIRWATEQGANVINLSLGGGYSSETHQALREAVQQGVLIVAAAGNEGRRGVGYPAANNDVCLSIAAVDWRDNIASFSSVGSANDFADYGVGVYSTYRGGGYARLSGTSMATPNMAAVAGAVMALEHKHVGEIVKRSVDEWIAFLNRWSVDRGRPGHDAWYGHGTLDFPAIIADYEAELMASDPEPDPEPEPPTTEPIIFRVENEITVTTGAWEMTRVGD